MSPDNGMAANLFLSTILHHFLDELVIDVTEEYLATLLSSKATRKRKQKFEDEDRRD